MVQRINRRLLPGALLAVLLMVVALPSRAQLPDSLSAGARISVLTVNPGEAVYSLWGHTALRVVDPGGGFDAVFNWGTFDPTRPWFVPRFAYGDMLYELSVEPMARFLSGATLQERGVVEQVLDLDPDEAQAMWVLLRENMKPENRAYAYDFVRDNCSTRILDLLLTVGAITIEDDGPDVTYRDMVDTYVHQAAWLDLGIHLAFGSPMDREVTPRDRAFLPLEFEVMLDASSKEDGEPIVSSKRTLLDIKWAPSLRGVNQVDWLFGGLGLLILVFTARTFRSPEAAPTKYDRFLMGFLGLAGFVLMLMWFASMHWVSAWNMDLMWALPTHLVVAVVWKRWTRLIPYMRVTGFIMLLGLALQLIGVQPPPPAMIVFVLTIGLRFALMRTPQA
ncbi:MAG: DUF4105 domain-containing protein [Bacteroidota bacterium]|nr:DUF4105 domain-containing protein [Bacteroidota bacterium]